MLTVPGAEQARASVRGGGFGLPVPFAPPESPIMVRARRGLVIGGGSTVWKYGQTETTRPSMANRKDTAWNCATI